MAVAQLSASSAAPSVSLVDGRAAGSVAVPRLSRRCSPPGTAGGGHLLRAIRGSDGQPQSSAAGCAKLVAELLATWYCGWVCNSSAPFGASRLGRRAAARTAAPADHHTAQHCTALHVTAHHSVPQHSTAQHSTPQHSTAHHSTALHSTALHSTSRLLSGRTVYRLVLRTPMFCAAL